MEDAILTLDAGTTGLKCSLMTPSGELLASAVSAYGVDMPAPGWAQQPVAWFIDAAVDAVRQALLGAQSARVAVIGLSGTMNGCIPVDASGEALFANIIHSDTRAEPQLSRIRACLSDEAYYARTGNRLDMHYTLPKILWLKAHHPDVFARARWYVNTKDALYGFLTGRHGMTDFSDASLTGALSIRRGAWDEDLLREVGLDPGVMPGILPSHDASGRLTREAARALGLPEGTPVAVGGGDGACATHGAGVYAPGMAYMNLGSSAWLCTLSEKPVIDAGMRVFSFFDIDGAHQSVCGTVQSAGAALDWALESLVLPGRKPGADAFEEMERLALGVPPGAEGVFFLPTLMGERTPWWDAHARGTLIGATLYHGRGHIARAAYEGVAQGLRLCDSVMRENGLAYDEMLLVGGGTASALLTQTLSDVLGMKTRVHAMARHATSLGAAMAAGVGVGLFRDYAEASRMARFDRERVPDPDRKVAYARHFEVYRALYPRMRDAYRLIGAYQQEQG